LTTEPIPEQWLRDFIEGAGIGIRFAYDEIPPEADPLGALYKLLFLNGPVTSAVFRTSGHYEVVFKSPLTGILCDCSSSGFWGSKLKKADSCIVNDEAGVAGRGGGGAVMGAKKLKAILVR